MHNEQHTGESNYELSDAQIKMILIGGVVSAGVCLVGFVVGFFVLKYFTNSRPVATDYVASPLAVDAQQWDVDIRLQATIDADYKVLEDQTRPKLDQYDVLSETPAVYQVPVDKAIEWTAKEGQLPNFDTLSVVQDSKQ